MIDRIGPTNRPAGPAVGYQNWRQLLFLHWEVPVEAMRSLVPAALELDLFEGRAYVGVVPFIMEGVRPAWWPQSMALRFLELNVRTYVHVNNRPGVYFFSLDANSFAAVMGARLGWGLPYFSARMAMKTQDDETLYTSVRNREVRHRVKYRVGNPLGPSEPGTLEHFLLERYLLFTAHKGRVTSGQVYHTPYPAQNAELLECEDTMVAAAGFDVGPKPHYVHYSEGVEVEVFGLKKE